MRRDWAQLASLGKVRRVAMLRRRRSCVVSGERRAKEKGGDNAVTGRGGAKMETVSRHTKSDQQMVPRSETLPLRCRGTIDTQRINSLVTAVQHQELRPFFHSVQF